VSANLDDLANLIEQARTRKTEMNAFESLFDAISVALTDVLTALETSGPSVAKAIADGIARIKFDAAMVTVNVEPTPITIQNSAPSIDLKPVFEFKPNMPAAKPWTELNIKFGHEQIGNEIVVTSAKVTR
jgi:hypothetical protein